MGRFFLLLLFSATSHICATAQFIEGLSYGKSYTAERIAEIHADKEIDVKKGFGKVTISLKISDGRYHYLLVELNNYNEVKGGKLTRILLSGIKFDEADMLFQQFLDSYGEPSKGYEEHCDYNDIRTGRITGWNKGCVYYNKTPAGDDVCLMLEPFDLVYDGIYTFEINSSNNGLNLVNLGNPKSSWVVPSAQNWKLTKTYGKGTNIK